MDLDLVRSTADRMFAQLLATQPVPGTAYGILVGPDLVHTGGAGLLQVGGDQVPDADTVFRMASMTKSFTAATVLLLRDDGRLRLDDPVTDHVPQLRGPAADPRVTVRHLLTMTAGLPLDDPWGDRQQDLGPDGFVSFLRSQPWLAWRPGEAAEYSNLGYALLGLVVEQVAGQPYREVVEQRLLAPLGLRSTGFDATAAGPGQLATGYVRRDQEWVEEPPAGYGAFAPMGGLFSTVTDLARWVAGFLAADGPDPSTPGTWKHPLHPWSLREMQHSARLLDADVTHPDPAAPAQLRVRGYGFGLVEEFFPEGRTVGHSGGYPGFGSHMRWHPESGLGVVALGNRTYAPMAPIATSVLRELVRSAAPVTTRRRVLVAPRMTAAREVVMRLLARWDDDLARAWFADNMAADEPLEHRQAWLEQVRERHGALRLAEDCPEPLAATTPTVACWWMAGERGGRVRVEVMLSPHREPLIQWLAVTSVPEPTAELAAAAVAFLATAKPAWWESARVGPATGGDGAYRAVFRVDGGPVPAEVEVRQGDGEPPHAELRVLPVRADIR